MSLETRSPAILRFATFELDLRAGELRKQGVRVKLQEQPYRVLSVLLQRPGEVVSREELRSEIWPADTFVDFDNSLNTSINKLRDALSDSANNPRFIETLPRRGYRFLLPVSSNDHVGSVVSPSTHAVSANASAVWKAAALVVMAALVGLAAGIFFWRSRKAQRLTEKDTIVLAEFANTTGDPIFDDSLKQGLRVQLEQSPFLNVLSDQQVDEQLKLMARSAGERLTPDLARDLCQRIGSKAVLNGTISSLGGHYVIGLNAFNCHTGVGLASEQVEADSREHVLKELGKSAVKMRERLGESLATIQKYDTPIEQATTSSLEALQAYSLAQKTWQTKGAVASLPFFRRAVKFDPNFAMAYGRMATAYGPAGENGLSIENIRKAYTLRKKVSDRERLYIEAHYYDIATQEIEKAVQVYQLWEQIYPRDPAPHDNLADGYWFLGQSEKALDEALETMRLRPNGVSSYEDVSRCYLRLGRLDEAQTVLRNAEQRGLESGWLDRTRYEAAFLKGDQDEMRRLAAEERRKPLLLYLQGYTEAYYGRVSKARVLWKQSEESFKHQDLVGFAAYVGASAALAEAVLGDSIHARADSLAALQLRETPQTRDMAALALALAADYRNAEDLAAKVRGNYPPMDPVFYLPTMRAASALGHKDATKAIDFLHGVSPYVGGDLEEMISVHLRAQAYLMLRDASAAAGEFQKILDHPGLVLENPVGALAHLGLGRAYVSQGDITKARVAYQAFLTLWKEADPDIPILKQAKAEYAKLQ